jgi:hypothetical protein
MADQHSLGRDIRGEQTQQYVVFVNHERVIDENI